MVHTVRVIRKQPYLLLEVLIAFFLVALCAIPLMQPQFAMLKAERAFTNVLTLDRVVNRLYAELLERFYRGEVSWASIGTLANPQSPHPITDPEVAALGFKGKYEIRVRHYPGKHGEYSKGGSKDPFRPDHRHLLEVQYQFTGNRGESLNYSFSLYVQTLTEVARAPAAR
jgi:hypothetical protein